MQLDNSIPLKQGEQFDISRLNNYLLETVPIIGTITNISRFPGGYSNITYCIQTANKEWVLRMPPAGAQIQSAHDMGREYCIIARILLLLVPHFI